jgi:hypothetical protein
MLMTMMNPTKLNQLMVQNLMVTQPFIYLVAGEIRATTRMRQRMTKLVEIKRQRRRMIAPTARGMATIAHIPKPHMRNASGIKSGRDGGRAQFAMSWR